MRLMRIPLAISAYVAGVVNLTYTPPQKSRMAVIGLGCDSKAALYDHECTALVHGAVNAVSKSTVDAVDYGVPLGHMCNFDQFDDLTSSNIACKRWKPWGGMLNDPNDYRNLIMRGARGEQLTDKELHRLSLAGQVPCEAFAAWPLQEGIEFKQTLKRIYGATAITKAWAYVIDFSDEQRELMSGCRMDFTDYPHWACQALIGTAAAGVTEDKAELRWNGQTMPWYALKVMQLFAMGHSNDGGTIVYDLDHVQNALIKIKQNDGSDIVPHWAAKRIPIYELASQILQQSDCSKNPEIILPYQAGFNIDLETEVSDFQKDIRLTFYGNLHPQEPGTKDLILT